MYCLGRSSFGIVKQKWELRLINSDCPVSNFAILISIFNHYRMKRALDEPDDLILIPN